MHSYKSSNINEKENLDRQLNKFYNEMKSKKYYGTTEILQITGISIRTLRYRIKQISKKYENVPSLIFKSGTKWKVHVSIIEEFMPIYNRKKYGNIHNWTSFITWVTKDEYDLDYHNLLIAQVKNKFPDGEFVEVVEKTKKGVLHVHMMSNLKPGILERDIYQIIKEFISPDHFRLEITEIRNRVLANRYLNK